MVRSATSKHFAGPCRWLSPLMFPVEILSTTARLLSLTVRLWANIFASDLIYGLFLGLFTGAGRLGLDEVSGCGRCRGHVPRVDSHRIYSAARVRFRHSDVRVHDSARRLHRHGHGGRALNSFVEPLQREPGCTVSGNHLLAAIHEEEVMKKAAVVMVALVVVLLVVARRRSRKRRTERQSRQSTRPRS